MSRRGVHMTGMRAPRLFCKFSWFQEIRSKIPSAVHAATDVERYRAAGGDVVSIINAVGATAGDLQSDPRVGEEIIVHKGIGGVLHEDARASAEAGGEHVADDAVLHYRRAAEHDDALRSNAGTFPGGIDGFDHAVPNRDRLAEVRQRNRIRFNSRPGAKMGVDVFHNDTMKVPFNAQAAIESINLSVAHGHVRERQSSRGESNSDSRRG